MDAFVNNNLGIKLVLFLMMLMLLVSTSKMKLLLISMKEVLESHFIMLTPTNEEFLSSGRGASILPNVCLSVGLSVGLSVCP